MIWTVICGRIPEGNDAVRRFRTTNRNIPSRPSQRTQVNRASRQRRCCVLPDVPQWKTRYKALIDIPQMLWDNYTTFRSILSVSSMTLAPSCSSAIDCGKKALISPIVLDMVSLAEKYSIAVHRRKGCFACMLGLAWDAGC